jgi:parallel beta-helix repeat protein
MLILILAQPAAVMAGGLGGGVEKEGVPNAAVQESPPEQPPVTGASSGPVVQMIPAVMPESPDTMFRSSYPMDDPLNYLAEPVLPVARLHTPFSMNEPTSPIIHRGELDLDGINPSWSSPLLSYGPNTPPPASGDWIINQPGNNVNNTTILLNGSLYIVAGELTLDNVTLIMNCTVDGQYQINISAGGTLNVTNTNITAFNGSLHYKFAVYGSMTMDRCNVSEMWGDYTIYRGVGGVTIFSNETKIRSSSISTSESSGIQVHSNARPEIVDTQIINNTRNGLITLDSAGPQISRCIFRANGNNGISIADSSAPVLMNCTFTGNIAMGIAIFDVSNSLITDCTVIDNLLDGIQVIDSALPNFTRCTFTGNRNGIAVFENSPAVFTNCTVSHNYDMGISVNGDAQPEFANCTSVYNVHGIGVFEDSAPKFTNCTVTNNSGYGIQISNQAQPKFMNCNSTDNILSGIVVYDTSTPDFTNCNAGNNSYYGIEVRVSSRPTFMKCNSTRNKLAGIYISSSLPAIFTNCSSSDNNFSGIEIYDQATPVLDHCSFVSNSANGIWISGTNKVVIRNCTSMRNNESGIAVYGASISEFMDCNSSDNSGDGIRIGEGARPAFTDCTMSENKWNGVSVYHIATPEFTGSTMSGNHMNGIGTYNSSTPIFRNCLVSSNQWYGINTKGEAQPEFKDCSMMNNNYSGIAVAGISSPICTGCSAMNNSGYGILIADVARSTFTNCTSSKNGMPGLVILDSSRPRMDGLRLSGNGRQNLWVISTEQVLLSNSTLGGESPYDMLLESGSKLTLRNTTYTKKAFVAGASQLKVQWYLGLMALDRADKTLAGAAFTGNGKNGSYIPRAVAGTDGIAREIITTEFIQNTTDSPFEFTYYSPYDIQLAIDGEKNITRNISVSCSLFLRHYLDFAPKIALLSDISVMEDLPKSLDMTPYLSDRDDSSEILGLSVDRDYISANNSSKRLIINCPLPLGSDTINITVSDGMKSSAQSLTILVTPTNDPPRCIKPIPNQTVLEDQTLELDLTKYFLDEENGTRLDFTCNFEEISIDKKTRKASWTPTGADVSLESVIITASDGELTGDSNKFDITVVRVNDRPEYIGGLSDETVKEHTNWTTDLSKHFRDEENSAGLIYVSSDPNVTINSVTNTARWSPSGISRYTIEVVFTAHDAENYSLTAESAAIFLTYSQVDDPPRNTNRIQDARIKYGEEWNITLEDYFTDDDSPTLKFSVSDPSVKIIEIGTTKHCAVWKPRKGDSNLTGILITAYDGTNRISSAPINLRFDAPAQGGGDDPSPITRFIQSMPWFFYALLPVGIIGGVAAYYTYRRIKYGKYEIAQLFLVYNDGRLIAHRQKRDTAQVSNDLLMGMLTALKGFIRESLQDQSKGELDQMQYGDLKIALEHGRTVYLAAFISGYVTDKLKAEMKTVVGKVEAGYEPVLRSWDGMMATVEGAGAFLDELMGKPGH